MNRENIKKELKVIFEDIFEDEDFEFSEDTSAADIEEWDSLNNVVLMSTIEKKFNIKFTLQELQEFKNVGGIIDKVASKI